MTLQSLTKGTYESYQKQAEFMKSSNMLISYPSFSGGWCNLDIIDLEIFVQCMEVFQTTGANYFEQYLELLMYGDSCQNGITSFISVFKYRRIEDRDILAKYEEAISKIIKNMQFFGIETIYSKTAQDFWNDLKKAKTEWTQWRQQKNINSIKKKTAEDKAFHDAYFNFAEFDMDLLEKHYKSAIKEIEKMKLYQHEIGDIVLNRKVDETFITVLFRNGTAEKITKTDNVLAWVERTKQSEKDTYGIYSIHRGLADELLVKILIHYPTIVGHPSFVNRNNKAFTTISLSKKIYNYLYDWNKRHINKIISMNGITTYNNGGQIIVEKALLDTHVRRFLRQENSNKKT